MNNLMGSRNWILKKYKVPPATLANRFFILNAVKNALVAIELLERIYESAKN